MPTTTSDALDPASAAERVRDQARRVRAEADSIRAYGARQVSAAREALLAAEQQAHDLEQTAVCAEQVAEALDSRGRLVDQVRAQGQEAAARGEVARALSDEHAALTARASGLEQRLGPLRGERDGLNARVTAARTAANVAEVKALRPDLDAIEEVIADLTRQLETARARLAELGEPDALAPLGLALRDAESRRRTYEAALRQLAPECVDEHSRRTVAYYLGRAHKATGGDEAAIHARVMAVLDEDPATAALLVGARVLRDGLDAR